MIEHILAILGTAAIVLGIIMAIMSVYNSVDWDARNISATALYWCAVGGIWWLWSIVRVIE